MYFFSRFLKIVEWTCDLVKDTIAVVSRRYWELPQVKHIKDALEKYEKIEEITMLYKRNVSRPKEKYI